MEHQGQNPRPFSHPLLSHWIVSDREASSFARTCLPDRDVDADVFPTSIVSQGNQTVISFGPLVRFAIDFDRRLIIPFGRSANASEADLQHFLFDQIAPRIIAGLGHLVLHGAAVVIDGSLAVFLGETGAGKSTLSARLHCEGHRLLGDDAVIISRLDNAGSAGVFQGEAVYPSLRLYPEAIAEILGDQVGTALMAHYSKKRHVINLPGFSAAAPRKPLGCIFKLTATDGAPQIRSLSVRESCIAMLEHSFALDPAELNAAKNRMESATALANAVPAYELAYPHDFDMLAEVCELVQRTVVDADINCTTQSNAL